MYPASPWQPSPALANPRSSPSSGAVSFCVVSRKVPIFLSGESLGGGLSLFTGLTLYDRQVSRSLPGGDTQSTLNHLD